MNEHTQALPKTLPQFIGHFLKKQKWSIIVIQLMWFGWSLDNTMWPLILGHVVDKITHYGADKSHMWYDFAPIFLLWLLLWSGVEVMFRTAGFMIAKVYPRIEAQMRMALYDYTQGHSYTYFANNLAGTLSNRINDMPQSTFRILILIQSLFIPGFVSLIIALGIFFTIKFEFALLLFVWVFLHIGYCFKVAPKCSQFSHVHSDARSTLTGKIVDSFTNMINIKLFARQSFEYQHINTYQEIERDKNRLALRYIEKIKVVLGILSVIFPGILMTFLMFYSWQHDQISVGQFVFIFNATWNIMQVAWHTGLELPNFFKEVGVCQQAMKLIEVDHEITDLPAAKDLQLTEGTIEFSRVNFHYTDKHIVFNDLCLNIPGGQKVGLVGYSGSGKSTFVNLLMRFFDPESGKVMIDGCDIKTITRKSLRESIAMIPQEPTLFHRSIFDNIRYGNPDASFEEVIVASKKAHCHEFIEQLAQGYETLVGERGIKLSGGQRQRIAIARAILKNAPLLILDEATSALDSVTEKYIQDSMRDFMNQRTTIVVAHRLSTLAEMDRILVFADGNIVEDGTHDELLKLQGRYATMWNMQAGGFLPDKPK